MNRLRVELGGIHEYEPTLSFGMFETDLICDPMPRVDTKP